MTLDKSRARQLLAVGDLRTLFVDALGWDRHAAVLDVQLGETTYSLQALAQKRGMVAWHCPTPVGKPLPAYATRRKVEHRVGKFAHEHLIVFTDSTKETQVWQWVKREMGKPTACREHTFHRSQSGEALLQKLEAIAFSLDEEEELSLIDVTSRARAGFDVERVTRRFYDRFQKEHAAFLKFVTGITERTDQEWYASVMLNRLMFVYFIQRKGFLDGDPNYLRNRLRRMQTEHGKDKFYSFYRYFLLRLFHEGLGGAERSPELEKLLGRIPYLNGGLFDIHELERSDRYGNSIQIPDKAFERIFDYFDQYQWHLDERPLRADNEINPDVLGYIFEKYINQKQMGAYYSKEDITEYISKNTVLPFLFENARARCKVAFDNPKGPTVWDLLREDPDRYIYPAVRHGLEAPLPDDIVAGLHPPTLHEPVGDAPSLSDIETIRVRGHWNEPAPPIYALPTETWREVVGRRTRCREMRDKLAAGQVRAINDLVTLNLDIRQFAQDVVENCEGPELLRAFWHAIENVTILDPTCGSGAFLFATLNILEPLYQACLDRMDAFVEDLERSGERHRPEKFSDFRKVLTNVAAHPNRQYFVFKSIILNNLYGVDIMEEAVEICKLRLFLKLAAQVEPDAAQSNLGIEPLPDIDFNVRAGNTLVGFVSYDDVQRTLAGKLDLDNAGERIRVTAADLQQAFDAFRARQVEGDGSVPTRDKQELRRRLNALDDELNRYLATEYGVEPTKNDAYAEWLKSHQPFHWFVHFYGIMTAGGFDVLIGNPPYVEYRKITRDYKVRHFSTEKCGNLYAFTWERSVALAMPTARLGLIIPVSSICTDGYASLRQVWFSSGHLAAASFNDRPGKLFDGLEHIRLTIVFLMKTKKSDREVHSTSYRRWLTETRKNLFPTLSLSQVTSLVNDGTIPKIGSSLEASLLSKVTSSRRTLEDFVSKTGESRIYYTRKLSWFVQVLDFVPSIIDGHGCKREPSELKEVVVPSEQHRNAFLCVLNSTLFYWYLTVWSDCRNLNKREVLGVPFDFDALDADTRKRFDCLAASLMESFRSNSRVAEINYADWGVMKIQCIYPRYSKAIIDEIDVVLAQHYGFTEAELDFIINYDIKYRVGRVEDAEEE